MKITPVERAARIKVLREKRKIEHETRVRDRAARLRTKKSTSGGKTPEGSKKEDSASCAGVT